MFVLFLNCQFILLCSLSHELVLNRILMADPGCSNYEVQDIWTLCSPVKDGAVNLCVLKALESLFAHTAATASGVRYVRG